MSNSVQFKNNLCDFFGIDHVSQPNDFIKEYLNKYFINIINDNITSISDTTDYLQGGNRSLDLEKLINNPLNNQLVNKFNHLVLNISLNFNIKCYQSLSENDKNVFHAFIINKLDNLSSVIRDMMNDNYWNQYISSYGIKKNTDIKKFVFNQISYNPDLISNLINLCIEIEKYKNDKSKRCIIL